MSTLPAPIVESNRSARPRLEHTFRSAARARYVSAKLPFFFISAAFGAETRALAFFGAPFVLRNARERSTMRFPFQSIVMRPSSVTVATMVDSRFSSLASAAKRSASAAATTTAMRSWDSLMASSVPSSPSYFFGTALRSMRRLSASSPTATLTPPAPKSLQRLMRRAASGLRNRRWSLRSSGALPFCTSAPQVSIEFVLCDLEDPVAPPQPSRPVRPPRRMTTSPGAGVSRRTFFSGTAPTTAPISMRFAA